MTTGPNATAGTNAYIESCYTSICKFTTRTNKRFTSAYCTGYFKHSPKTFREWIKSIEKYAVLVNVPDARKELLAYQLSGGVVSGFIQRYMPANPNSTWAQLKEQLAVRFSDVTDAQMALSLLRQVTQKTGGINSNRFWEDTVFGWRSLQ